MSHHVEKSLSNPGGAVEVVRAPSSSATTAPVDGGSSVGSGAPATSAVATAPVSTEVGGATGTAAAPVTPATVQSGTPGANLPVEGLQQASTTIEGAKADLTRTAGAERRLDSFDLVGGDGGGGGDAGQENANNAEGAVAQGTADLNVSDQDGGIGGDRIMGETELTTTADQNANQGADAAVNQGGDVTGQEVAADQTGGENADKLGNENGDQNLGATNQSVDGTGQSTVSTADQSASVSPETDLRSSI